MDINTLCNLIKLQPEIIQKVNKFINENDVSLFQEELNGFLYEETAYTTYEKLNKRYEKEKDNTAILTCYLLACLKVYDLYQNQNIENDIFIDTMKCYTRFIDECKEKTGTYDFDRAWWTHKQVSQVIYRIGELEYEFIEKEKIVNIHIPSDAKMSKENLQHSIDLLNDFIEKHKPEYKNSKIICDTWLLSPKLKTILNEKSNILNFQNLFNIIRVDENNDGCFEWVFKTKYHKEFEKLPENTSLQRKIKQIMLQGKHLGSAYGELK